MNVRRFESDASETVLAELRRMASSSGKLRTSSCMPKLATKLGLSRVAVDEAIRDLHRAGLLNYQADGRELPVSGHISVALESVAPSRHETVWKHALEDVGFEQAAVGNLTGLYQHLQDMTDADLAVLACGLKKLCEAGANVTDDAGFNVSARHLMGGSKVLSCLTRRMLDSIGLPLRLHNASPKYVICAGPATPVATLLIENPRAFENAVRSGLAQEVALICTFGFGLSYLGQEWLHVDDTPPHDRPILIVRHGTPPALSSLLTATSVYLWADLDQAAISIYRSLKSAIPQLQLSRIYEAMVPMVQDPHRSHPYVAIFDKNGQQGGHSEELSAGRNDSTAAAFILQVCRDRAVDQEAVAESVIRALGPFPYAG